jgi:hypothetical protein
MCVIHSTGFSNLRVTFNSNQNNTPFTIDTTGTAVQQARVTGTTSAQGAGSATITILQFGVYNSTITITVNGVTGTATAGMTVTSANTCT